MSRSVVVGSYAVMAVLLDEPEGSAVRKLFGEAAEAGELLPMCVVNWGEVVYSTMRLRRRATEAVVAILEQLPIALVDADRELTVRAVAIKAGYPLSYADAYCAALATVLRAPVLTGDPEFAPLERDGLIEVRWLR